MTFAEDVKVGLTAGNKFLLPKYFYDEKGSALFDKICLTDEYYITRTESEILRSYCKELTQLNCNKKATVELGSGSAVKTKYILDAFLSAKGNITYIPIDVSTILIDSAKELLRLNDSLCIDGIIGEYEKGLILSAELCKGPKMIIFLGSSIGNLTPDEAKKFVKFVSDNMSEEDSLLIGFDMVKDIEVLNKAYNDSMGVTTEFNLNLLVRINNELGGHFDLAEFEHQAFFNGQETRIEMHLVSKSKQDVRIDSINETIHFEKGEKIHTENSYKFTDKMIEELAEYSELGIVSKKKDAKGYFSLCLFTKHPSHT